MSHEHNDHCGHEAHDHDHDHQGGSGPDDNLFTQIDRSNVIALNANGEGSVVIKPWHQRLDESEFLQSDADDSMIIRIPFTASVKLKSLLLKTGPAEQTPSKMLLFPNSPTFDFNDVADKAAAQEFDVVQSRDVGEYHLKAAKFSNISHLTLYLPEAQGGDTLQIYYIGFLGTWTPHQNMPIITVYEAQANLADHEKIQGTDSNGFNFKA
ncbi:hypothetical protein HGRIS_003662 [Hohenbuehelia grisea]|uniref:PITH domain-containing protein n=1 Tax=Hohenbuehelia grisea TaxID=104357 RepID=A0ABR3JG51_9AGAR